MKLSKSVIVSQVGYIPRRSCHLGSVVRYAGLDRPLCRVEVPPELVLVSLLAEKDEAALLRHPSGGHVIDVAGQVGAAKADLLHSPGEERLERTGRDTLSPQLGGDVVGHLSVVAV